jgi:uncharacterized protein (DUF1778 family)
MRTVTLRLCADDLTMIDRAARMMGLTRSEFIILASREAAEPSLLDRKIISMGPESFDHFIEQLSHIPEPDERLCELMRRPAPWEQQ